MNPTTSADALTQLQQTQAQSQDPNTILSGQRQQLGVNAANDTVTGLRGAINNTTKLLKQVAPSVMGRTGNSLVTSAQAGRIIQNEQAPISDNLTDQGTQYNQAQDDYNKLEQQAETAASGVYTGQQDKLSYAQNLYNVLYQKEKDAQAEADAQQARQDALNEAAATRKAASGGSSGGGFNLSGGSGVSGSAAAPAVGGTLSGGKSAANADAAVRSLINTNDAGTIINTINSISKSASYGNTYDQAKLQLLERYMPGWFKGNTLNAAYIQNLAKNKALKFKV